MTPSTQRATSWSELLAELVHDDFRVLRDGVFHDVVQQAGFHGHHIHPHVRQDMGHHDRMSHVGLAGIADLVLVIAASEFKGVAQRREVVLRTILADFLFQLVIEFADGVYEWRFGDSGH